MPASSIPAADIDVNRLLTLLYRLPWLDIAAAAVKAGRKLWRGLADEGLYEVLDYEATLELQDVKGVHASYHKRQRVRYLQNNIIAYQDHVWSDGQSPLDYQCSPGVVVDQYRPGNITTMLISLRQSKRRGETDEFNIAWDIRNGFKRSEELLQTAIYHRTRNMTVQVIFPQKRPPLAYWVSEELHRRRQPLPQRALRQRLDGRWQLTWHVPNPHLNERYNLHWQW